MRKGGVIVCGLLGVVAGLGFGLDGHAHRVPSDREDCSQFQFDMPRQVAEAMANPARKVTTGQDRNAKNLLQPSSQALTVALHRAGRVEGAAKADPGVSLPGAYSGLLPVTVPRDGLYRVSATAPLWLKVFTGQTRVRSDRFELQTGCDRTFKSFTYRLRAGASYWVELSSDQREIILAITPE